jgi:YD repeat-containing protein
LTVASGQYQVRLHFAETYSGAFAVGARVFNVQLEGATALSNVDVFAEAGANTALVKTATTTVADGQLNIRFVHGADNPFINAIEVLSPPPADGEAPTAPTGLSAAPISGAAIALTWSAATDNVGVTGYAIERCAGAGCSNFAEVATTAGTARNDIGLVPNTTYRYRARAFDATGNRSAYSSVAEATTPNATAEYVYDELGRLVLVTTASGASIVYSYDESGNVTAILRAAP